MDPLPVHKRKFHAFLSHAHVDKGVVDRIDCWLNESAGIPVWYDARNLAGSALIGTKLPEAIIQCRAMILALSKASIDSGWVEEEYNAAIGQRTQFREYRIIPIRLENCPAPYFLTTTKWIDMLDGNLAIGVADEILASLYNVDTSLDASHSRDVYVSRTWHENESRLADQVCRMLVESGLRLIGDSKDQAGFEEGHRVSSIIASCGGCVAILPDRGQGATSKYMLKEIAIARDQGLPLLVVAEPGVELPPDIASLAIRITAEDLQQTGSHHAALRNGIETLAEEWASPAEPHYIFFAANFDGEFKERNRFLRQAIARITAMPCVMGDDIRQGQIQQVITGLLRRALVVIADINEENINTCIEAGVALGAGRRLHLIAAGPRRRPPFMFRDQQVWHYANETELLGTVHRIACIYRRRVLNCELRS